MTHRSIASLAAGVATCLSLAQSSIPKPNPVQAIVGARIEIGDGRTIEKGNVVMRDGILVAVGADAQVPKGAEVLDGTGLTVYPGFIDAYSNNGLRLPEPPPAVAGQPPRSEYASAFMDEESRKGIVPDLSIARTYAPTREFLSPYWNAGFTSAHLVPSGYIGGLSALVNLSGKSGRQSALPIPPVLGISFATVTGEGYPARLLGAVSHIRQALADAQWFAAVSQAYEGGARVRPPQDESLATLASRRGERAFFVAQTAPQIDRSLDIAQEFGFAPGIVGGGEAWRRADLLAAKRVPVVVSLAFGREPGLRPTPEPPGQGDDPTDPEDAADKLEERRRLYLESVRNVVVLSQRGVPFAFTTRGARNPQEFMENLRRVVKEGLPPEAALKALTIHAADMLGIGGRLGMIEPGKIANLTVLTGDFLEARTRTRMLFIDGERIDPSRNAEPPAQRGRRPGEEDHRG